MAIVGTIKQITLPDGNSYQISALGNGGFYASIPTLTADSVIALTSDIPTNYVTTDTTQTISGEKTFTQDITIQKSSPRLIMQPYGSNGWRAFYGINEIKRVYTTLPTPDTPASVTTYTYTFPTQSGTIALAANIPTVNDAALTIQGAGVAAATFSANQSADAILNIKGSGATTVSKTAAGEITISSTDTTYSIATSISASSSNSEVAGAKAVYDAIEALPEPMIFKGSVGDSGTVTWTNLPAATSSEGWTYKVITAHATAPVCKVGDTIVSNGTDWVVIPSGDEPSGTVTSVGLTMPTGFTVSSSPVTSSGTIAVTYATGYSIPTNAKQAEWDAKPSTDTNYYHTAGSWSGYSYTLTGQGGASNITITLPVGTAATQVAAGNHNHDSAYLGKTAKAADADKLDGQDGTYYLNYNNFTNTPTIPTVNNGTLTINANGTSAGTFSANQSGNTTVNLNTAEVIDVTDGVSAAIKTKITNNPAIILKYDEYYYVPQYADGNGLPSYYNCFEGDSQTFHWLEIDWTNLTVTHSNMDYVVQGDVHNGALTIQRNGTTLATFSANQSEAATVNISVPTADSNLTNDRYVRYDTNAQGLTNTQKTNARTNIGAGTYSKPTTGIPASDLAQSYVTTNTTQTISAAKTFTHDLYFGATTANSRAVGDAPAVGHILSFNKAPGFVQMFWPLSGVGDELYLAYLKSEYEIRTSYKGTGAADDEYNANLYLWDGSTPASTKSLFNWQLSNGWRVLPSKLSASTPAIIEIKKSGNRIESTDADRLILTGHGGYDQAGHYSGFLQAYKIEVCTSYTNNTWVTVVDRSGVDDAIGTGLMFALQTGSYTDMYGIRLTITQARVTGASGSFAFINISSMQLRNYRPSYTVPQSLGALPIEGGNMYGNIVACGPNRGYYPDVTNEGTIGTASKQWKNVYTKNLYLNGTDITTMYAAKSHASSNTTFGIGTLSYYGHVKLGAADQNGATAADGVAAPNGHTHSQYEASINKVTTISAASTDTQYPSAKSVYTAIQGTQIEIVDLTTLA